jgi:hypothetical protein
VSVSLRSAVPDEHHLAALARAVAQLVGAAAFDDGHVMGLLLAILGIGHAQTAHVVGAQVHPEEVSGGDGPQFALRVLALGIEAGCLVVVPVHRVDVPALEFFALSVRIGDALLHRVGQQIVERGDVGEPPPAFQCFEKMARRDVGLPLVDMELKELLAAGGTAQTAQDAELAVVDVGNVGAAVLAGRKGIEL